MSTALEQMHEMEPHIRVARARAGVLMLILSDALSVLAILAAGGYLSALNVENQFLIASDHGPAFVPSLLVVVILVLSGVAYYVWEQRARSNEGAGPQFLLILSLVFMVAAMVGQLWIGAKLGYVSPFHAYESLIMLLTWYTSMHLLLTAIIGLLLLGRVLRGRIAGHGYIPEVVGYWWYYTVVASVIMWLFSAFIR